MNVNVNINVRVMEERDYKDVLRLMNQLHNIHVVARPDIFKDDLDFSEKFFDELINDENKLTLLIEDGSDVMAIAYITIRENKVDIDKKIGYIEAVCVDEKYRGRGFGSEIVGQIEALAKTKGIGRIDLMVWGFNEGAIEFYQGLGFDVQRFMFEKEI